ncbi:MAG: FKBP-type peptidyl-prolyl cis-trans isomerase [Candidatus Ranarchaeia archaeon]
MPKTPSKSAKSQVKKKRKAKTSNKEKISSKKKEIVETGDYVMIDYVGRVKDSNLIFDCTKEDIARKENIYDEKQVYGPQLLILGEGKFMKGFEKRLEGVEVGGKYQFEIPPEEGFGRRDPGKIKIHNIRDFRNQNIKPRIGQRVRIGQHAGTVVRVGGGRVVVDYNPQLAGKVLAYTVWVHEKLKTEDQKILQLISRRVGPTLAEQFEVKKKPGSLEIKVPPVTFYSQQIQLIKAGIALDMFKLFTKVKKVTFTETHERPQTDEKSSSKRKKSTKKTEKK